MQCLTARAKMAIPESYPRATAEARGTSAGLRHAPRLGLCSDSPEPVCSLGFASALRLNDFRCLDPLGTDQVLMPSATSRCHSPSECW